MKLLDLLSRAWASDTRWALLDQGLALVASTISFLLLGRVLGPAGYGAFVGLYALMGPFLAPTVSGVFFCALEHIVREGEDPVDVARSCLGMTVAIALLCVPVLSAVGLIWIEGLPAVATVLLVGAEFLLNGLVAASQAMVQALTGFPAASRLRMTSSFSRIGLLAVLAGTGSLTLTTLAVGQVVTLGAVSVFALTRVSRRLGVPARPGRIRPRHVRSVMLYGLGIGASNAQGDGDKFVLNAAHHQADAGRYGAAYRLMQIVQLPVSALLGATHLSFLNAREEQGSQWRRAVRLSLVAAAYAVPAVAALVLVAPLVPRILTRDFAETTVILQLLAPVVILRSIGGFPMNGLMGLGRNALRTKLLIGNALFSLALYAALIPGYSWRGALVATLISETSLCGSGWLALYWCDRGPRTGPIEAPPAQEARAPAPPGRGASARRTLIDSAVSPVGTPHQ
jgi:O-antigen/teichoic acid export membrane protein